MINKKNSEFTLAGATHVAKSENIQNFGFTLAEVLITLGIIGVVAAITMPTLIQNYKKQVYVNQLKKSVSTLEQGFRKMMADEGVSKMTDLSYWNVSIGHSCVTYDDEITAKSAVDNIFSKAFNVTFNKAPNFKIQEDGYSNQIQFADGSSILDMSFCGIRTLGTLRCNQIKSFGGNTCSEITELKIDTNGTIGPNKYGRDIFLFHLSDEGKLYPHAGKDFALFSSDSPLTSNTYYWKNNQSWCSDSNENARQGCAARIMENGWKMDY